MQTPQKKKTKPKQFQPFFIFIKYENAKHIFVKHPTEVSGWNDELLILMMDNNSYINHMATDDGVRMPDWLKLKLI